MSLSLRGRRAETKRALNVEVVLAGRPARLTGYWNDGFVEVTQGGAARILDVVDLAREEPGLLRALGVLVQQVCCAQVANAKLRQMTAAVQREECVRTKTGHCRREGLTELRREENARRYAAREADPTRGMVPLSVRVGDLTLSGVTPDGRDWLVCGQRVPFTALAETVPDMLAELLLAARPALRNFAGFAAAVCRSYPAVRTHPQFCGKVAKAKAGKQVVGSPDPGFEWVADALAVHQQGPRGERPLMRPLHNRARHVR
ncbi:hypothetical protein [Deinococcus aluminii]|uniref:Uncharacterized protein n=1 Tax=Deinococcus aluminii TaxID=1656885 RepID=A0ABP9XF13_9DEIO